MSDVYQHLLTRLAQQLVGEGLSQAQASQLSARTVALISQELGGQQVYLPRRVPWFNRGERDRQIRSCFDGRNLAEVCTRFGVSRATVYRICKK